MCDRSERRLLAEERESDTYREYFQQVDEQMRLAYEADFGPHYRSLHPYRTDGPLVDKIVTKMMRSGWSD